MRAARAGGGSLGDAQGWSVARAGDALDWSWGWGCLQALTCSVEGQILSGQVKVSQKGLEHSWVLSGIFGILL